VAQDIDANKVYSAQFRCYFKVVPRFGLNFWFSVKFDAQTVISKGEDALPKCHHLDYLHGRLETSQ
jgi:hypothetical protein